MADYEPIGKAIGRSIREVTGIADSVLSDYVIKDYVPSDRIPVENIDGMDERQSADRFFGGKYGRGFSVLELPDFDLVVFETFLVIEIQPRTGQTSFLVLAPRTDESLPASIMAGIDTASTLRLLGHPKNKLETAKDIRKLFDSLRLAA